MIFRARTLFSLLLLLSPLALSAQRERLPMADLLIVEKNWPDAKKTSTGLRYMILEEGQGDAPRPGDIVGVNYRGMFLNGEIFEENQDQVNPLTFRLGRGLVIEGWEQGLKLVRPGGRILLIVPPSLAYGTRGDPPVIGPDVTLIFEVKLVTVQPD